MITAEALFAADTQGSFMLVPEYYEPTKNDFAFESQVNVDDVITTLILMNNEGAHEAVFDKQARFVANLDW